MKLVDSAAGLVSAELTARLAALAIELTDERCWPAAQFGLLRGEVVLKWVVPADYGGQPLDPAQLLSSYVALARACLTTTFVLTQRNGACQRIAQSENSELKRRLLPRLARGELFATVGISHLTTSRQHQGIPAVLATEIPGGVELTGQVPWVTGAAHADYFVTGGAFADGRQILAAVPADCPGLVVGPAARLLAVTASQTSAVEFNQVRLDNEWIIQPPAFNVMQQGPGVSTGSLSTSALAVGLTLAALDALDHEASLRPALHEISFALGSEVRHLQTDLLMAAGPDRCESHSGSNETLRSRANSLVLRSTQALLGASKGAGFIQGHFAERAAREALFFLVWSCPQPVLSANLRALAGLSSDSPGH